MAKPGGRVSLQTKWLPLLLLVAFSVAFFIRGLFDSCDIRRNAAPSLPGETGQIEIGAPEAKREQNPLDFMKSNLVLLVSLELSLSGGPLLLMELASLLRNDVARIVWITNQNPIEMDEVTYSLEHKMLDKGVQVFPAKSQESVDIALKADLVVLSTAVAGKWLDDVLKKHVPRVLPRILWWIHERRGHYIKTEYVKHLPFVAGAMIDSHTTAEYWKNRTRKCLRIKMPQTFVVHLGNSKDLMEVAEDIVMKRVLREHVFLVEKARICFFVHFMKAWSLSKKRKLKVPPLHAVVVGSDMKVHVKYEIELREFVLKNEIRDHVHLFNKTLTVAPYLAAVDALIRNSQGTSAGGTMEIVLDGVTGILHPVGKEGVRPLASRIVQLATHAERRPTLGTKGLRG